MVRSLHGRRQEPKGRCQFNEGNICKLGAFAGAIYLALWTQTLFFKSNEEHQALLSIAALEKSNDDNFPLEVKTFLPDTCHEHVVHNFPTLTSLLDRGKDSSLGSEGGHWSACTHIQIYGTNFAAFFARHLAYGIQPKTVLEFGCGLGTTSDFLARFVPGAGGSKVVCVEPEAMLGEVFAGSEWFPQRPIQLAMMSFAPEAKSCSDKLFSTEMQFELVLSLEVAEHVPPEHTAELIERLARATSKYLVFSAARPGQGGTGHIDDSSHSREWWIDQFTSADRGEGKGKLRLLPQLSRVTYSLFTNNEHSRGAFVLFHMLPSYSSLLQGWKDDHGAINIVHGVA